MIDTKTWLTYQLLMFNAELIYYFFAEFILGLFQPKSHTYDFCDWGPDLQLIVFECKEVKFTENFLSFRSILYVLVVFGTPHNKTK